MTADEMRKMDIRNVDPETLVDIRDVVIDESLPKEERIRSFVKQIKNPYVFRYGDYVVKTTFAEHGPTLEECLENYLRNR